MLLIFWNLKVLVLITKNLAENYSWGKKKIIQTFFLNHMMKSISFFFGSDNLSHSFLEFNDFSICHIP